jgi:hypothetical protein
MHAKLFVELGVEVGSRLALISTQLNSSLAATVASLCIAASACYALSRLVYANIRGRNT